MPPKSNKEPYNLVKDIFKTRATPRKKLSSIFSHMHLPIPSSQTPPIPERALKPEYLPAAIEISSTAIKLLQLAKTQEGHYEICKFAYLPMPSQDTTGETLKKIVEESAIKGEIVGSLPISKLQTFTYILPPMPKSEIEQAVAWKLKQNPPAGATFEGISFDFCLCSHSQESVDSEMRVLVFVVSKALVLEQMKLFQGLSLELIAIEPKPYAALNALLWLGKIRQDETALVLQLGASQSAITIVHSGLPYLIRPLSVSGNTFTEAIANYHQFDWQKAENIKKQDGLKPGSICAQALSSQLENLVVDVEHTFKYFSHQLMKSQITSFERILLCGGSSGLVNLAAFLTERLGVPVDVVSPLSALNLCLKTELSSKGLLENSARFTSTLGLSLRYIGW